MSSLCYTQKSIYKKSFNQSAKQKMVKTENNGKNKRKLGKLSNKRYFHITTKNFFCAISKSNLTSFVIQYRPRNMFGSPCLFYMCPDFSTMSIQVEKSLNIL